jgi:hypothetical protein
MPAPFFADTLRMLPLNPFSFITLCAPPLGMVDFVTKLVPRHRALTHAAPGSFR